MQPKRAGGRTNRRRRVKVGRPQIAHGVETQDLASLPHALRDRLRSLCGARAEARAYKPAPQLGMAQGDQNNPSTDK